MFHFKNLENHYNFLHVFFILHLYMFPRVVNTHMLFFDAPLHIHTEMGYFKLNTVDWLPLSSVRVRFGIRTSLKFGKPLPD